MNYLIYYKITSRSHGKFLNPHYISDNSVNAFKDAIKMMKAVNPKHDIDKWYAFYVVPCDTNGYLFSGNGMLGRHGWARGGKIEYPLEKT